MAQIRIEHGRRVITLSTKPRVRTYYARYLMELSIGRKLLKNEHVHHKDGNKLNDDLSNLEILDIKEHAKLHSVGKKYPSRQKKVEKTCLTCHTSYCVKPCRIDRSKFCSVECRLSFNYVHGDTRDKQCPNCKTLIMRKSSFCRSCSQLSSTNYFYTQQ